jgi:hypothetical protein
MKKRNLILFGFILLKFFLQYFLISPEYDLQRDEYLHLDQANHLAWGFLSVPPVTSWIAWLIKMLGNSVFWVKFFPALFGALTIIVVWKATEKLKGNLFTLILCATCTLFSTLLRMNILFQPNSLDILCWTTFYSIIILYFTTERPKWLYVAALVFSIGFLNKYNIVFLVVGLLPAILFTSQRNVFTKKELYMAFFMAFLLIFPNLIWQYKNNFPVFHHLKELTDTQLINVDRLDFLKSQLMFFAGSLFVIISGLFALLFYPPFRKYKSFFWALLFTLLVFLYFRAKAYYAIGLYPIYISFGSVFLGNIIAKKWRIYIYPVLMVMPMLFFVLMYMIAFPNKSPAYFVENAPTYQKYGLLRWEDGKDHVLQQDFADMLGWKELATMVDRVFSELPNPEQTLIICDNYGQAGAINYYSTNKQVVAHSFNADYINWIRLDNQIINLVLVKEPGDTDKERMNEKPFFDTVYLAGQRINPYAREDSISVYVLKGAKVDVNEIIKDEIAQRKIK